MTSREMKDNPGPGLKAKMRSAFSCLFDPEVKPKPLPGYNITVDCVSDLKTFQGQDTKAARHPAIPSQGMNTFTADIQQQGHSSKFTVCSAKFCLYHQQSK